MAIPEMLIELALPFNREAVMAELVEPVLVCGKVSLAGVTVTEPEVDAVPVPERAIVCGLLVPASLKLSVAVRVPVPLGAK